MLSDTPTMQTMSFISESFNHMLHLRSLIAEWISEFAI